MFILVLMRRPVIEILFQHGQFDKKSTEVTAWALCFMAISLPFQAVVKIIVQAYYALKDFRTPAAIAGLAIGINILMAGLLFRWLGVGGLSLATSLALIFNLAILIILFRRHFGPFEEEDKLLGAVGRIFFASLLLGSTSYMLITLPGFYGYPSFGRQVLAFAAAVIVGVVVYIVTCWIMRAKEIQEVWGIVVNDREDFQFLS